MMRIAIVSVLVVLAGLGIMIGETALTTWNARGWKYQLLRRSGLIASRTAAMLGALAFLAACAVWGVMFGLLFIHLWN